MSERAEDFVTTAQGRDNVTRARLALDAEGHFLALDAVTVANLGAYLSPAPGQLHQRAGERDGQWLCHSGDLHGCAGRVHQHRADRRLSRRWQAGSELHDRAPDRRGRARCGFDTIELRRRNLVRGIPVSQGARHRHRLRPLRRQPRRCDRRRGSCRVRRTTRCFGAWRHAARPRRDLLHGDRTRRTKRRRGTSLR